ncbi:MAG: hypothetical protein LBP55_02670, partial [Candidatus Adiutrix sp.]|nr:hypothetical protein [Candidatus Adiutrix sp.]
MKKLHFALGLAVAIAFVAPDWALALPDPNLKGGDGYGRTAPATDVNNASHGPNTTQLTERWPAGSISLGYGMGGYAEWSIDAPNNSNYIVDALTITGGRGGDGTSIYGNGGDGGSAALMPFNGGSRNVYVTGAVNITAGNGGNGDYLNAGGYGGSAYLTLGSNGTLQAQSLTIKGGDDGAGNYSYVAGGGRAWLSLGNLMVNQLRVESGSESGNGGGARLVAENVSVAGSGTFIAQDGALNILVGKLNVAEKASILL